MKNFTKFAVGEVILNAGVRITRLVMWGSSMGKTEYAVELTCCGVRRFMTHADVLKRGRRKRAGVPRTCKNCRGHSREWRKQRKINARATQECSIVPEMLKHGLDAPEWSIVPEMLQRGLRNAPAWLEEFYWEMH